MVDMRVDMVYMDNMSGFVKLFPSILRSTIWYKRPDREIFLTALLLAEPRELLEPEPQLRVDSLEKTGWVVPPGWYGFVEASGMGIVRAAGEDLGAGMEALRQMGEPEAESRSQEFEGRRLVRVDHGYVVLNYMTYRELDVSNAERCARYRKRQKEKAKRLSKAQWKKKLSGGEWNKELAKVMSKKPNQG